MKYLITFLTLLLFKTSQAQFDLFSISNNGLYLISKHTKEKCFKLYNIKDVKLIDSFYTFYPINLPHSFSSNSKYFAFIDTLKQLSLYKIDEKKCYKLGNPLSLGEESFRFSSDDSFLISTYYRGSGPGDIEGGRLYVYYKDYLLPDKIKPYSFGHPKRYDQNYGYISSLKNNKSYAFHYDFEKKKSCISAYELLNDNAYNQIKEPELTYFNFTPLTFYGDSNAYSSPREPLVLPDITESKSGKYLFATYYNHSYEGLLINPKNLKIVSKIKSKNFINSIDFSDDEKQLLTLNANKQLCLWDVKTGKLLAEMDKMLIPKLKKGLVPEPDENYSYRDEFDNLKIQFGFVKGNNKFIMYYFANVGNHYFKRGFYLFNKSNLNLIKKLGPNEIIQNSYIGNSTSYENYIDYTPNERSLMPTLATNNFFITTFQKITNKETLKFDYLNIRSSKTLEVIKKINKKDRKLISIKMQNNNSQTNRYFSEIKVNKSYLFSENNERIIETDWSIIDFLVTLIKEKSIIK